MNDFTIRPARVEDVPLILALIRELADYENMLDQVTATEEILKEWLFEKKTAEVLIPQVGDSPIGYALFFHNFSTFLGKGGLYLEDVYIRPEYRGNGYGKAVFRELARIAEERGCGRLEWVCLDWNQPSIDFYLSMEAEPQGEWTIYRLTGETLHNVAKGEEI